MHVLQLLLLFFKWWLLGSSFWIWYFVNTLTQQCLWMEGQHHHDGGVLEHESGDFNSSPVCVTLGKSHHLSKSVYLSFLQRLFQSVDGGFITASHRPWRVGLCGCGWVSGCLWISLVRCPPPPFCLLQSRFTEDFSLYPRCCLLVTPLLPSQIPPLPSYMDRSLLPWAARQVTITKQL